MQLPSPQTAGVVVVAVTVHPVVSKAHNPVQESVPEVNPLETQVSPPKADPSHCSPVSIIPFPQFRVVMQLPEEHVCPEPQFVVDPSQHVRCAVEPEHIFAPKVCESHPELIEQPL